MTKPSLEKPWLNLYSPKAIDAVFSSETIYQNIYNHSRNNLESIAINYFDNKITYKKFFELIDQCASSLKSLGVKKNDVVAIVSATTPEIAILLYALNKLGATLYTIDPKRSEEEIQNFIIESKANVLFILDMAFEHVKNILKNVNLEKIVIINFDTYMSLIPKTIIKIKYKNNINYSNKIISWKKFMSLGVEECETINADQFKLAAITLTGGTTGTPKGVMLSNDGFNAIAFDFKYSGVKYKTNQKFLNIIPAFSSYGLVTSLHMPLSLGLQIVMIPRINPDKIGKIVKKYKPNHTLLVPTYYERLINSKDIKEDEDLSYFETAGSGGDTMNRELETKLNCFLQKHHCKYPLSQGYGMSEVSSAASCCCAGNFKSLSVGYPLLLSNVSIFKPGTDEELDYNQEGEVCISGPSVMLGYFNNQNETDKVLIKHKDGNVWIHSGDLGYMDEDGYLFIKDRIKRMITRFDGHKVFPTQLEAMLETIDNVMNCVVIGRTDKKHAQGEEPIAIVKLKDKSLKDITFTKLNDYIQTKVEERGRPQEIFVVDNLPHTTMGKVDYKLLKDQFNETK